MRQNRGERSMGGGVGRKEVCAHINTNICIYFNCLWTKLLFRDYT